MKDKLIENLVGMLSKVLFSIPKFKKCPVCQAIPIIKGHEKHCTILNAFNLLDQIYKSEPPKIIPKSELVDKSFYLGHKQSRFPVAYWDAENQEFVSIDKKSSVALKRMNHWDDIEFAAFGPIERL